MYAINYLKGIKLKGIIETNLKHMSYDWCEIKNWVIIKTWVKVGGMKVTFGYF